jgi:DNA-binding IclR family transcriptional regulator
MDRAMTKEWRPHVDLARLSTALSEEILAAAEWEVRRLHAETGYSITAAARDVRELIAAASGEAGEGDPELVAAHGVHLSPSCVRQH